MLAAGVNDSGLLGAGEMAPGIGLRPLAGTRTLGPRTLAAMRRAGCGGRGMLARLDLAGERQGAADQLLDVAQLAALGAVTQRDGKARRAVTGGTADTVDVVLGIIRQFVVDHVGDVGHVDAARRDIGRHQDAYFARRKALERRLAGVLALVAVDGSGLVTVDLEVLGHPIGAMLGAREDDDAFEGRVGKQCVEFVALLLGTRKDHALVDRRDRGRRRLRFDPHRVVQQTLGEFGDLFGHGGREQSRLAPRADGGRDLLDRVNETHVEHPVGFVEDEPAGLVEADLLVVEQILEAARRRDYNVGAFGDLLDLRVARDAAEDENGLQPHAVRQLLQHFLDLHGEFAGRRQDQGTRGHRLRTAFELSDAGNDGQAESGRLARPRLRDAEDVAALQLGRNGLRLDGRRHGETGLVESSQNLRRQAEGSETCVVQCKIQLALPDHTGRTTALMAAEY